MYSGERHIDSCDAMQHNEQVEQERQAEHLRRCAESQAYKRVYERWQAMNKVAMQQAATIQQTIHDQMCQQQAQPISDTMKAQPVKLGECPEPIPLPENLQQMAGYNNPWTWFILGMMFADDEKLKQMREDAAATKEMMEVNERYDRQIIRLSGFEW